MAPQLHEAANRAPCPPVGRLRVCGQHAAALRAEPADAGLIHTIGKHQEPLIALRFCDLSVLIGGQSLRVVAREASESGATNVGFFSKRAEDGFNLAAARRFQAVRQILDLGFRLPHDKNQAFDRGIHV